MGLCYSKKVEDPILSEICMLETNQKQVETIKTYIMNEAITRHGINSKELITEINTDITNSKNTTKNLDTINSILEHIHMANDLMSKLTAETNLDTKLTMYCKHMDMLKTIVNLYESIFQKNKIQI